MSVRSNEEPPVRVLNQAPPGPTAYEWMIRPEIHLLRSRERILFAALALVRVVVGGCDLAMAASMYLLFLLLQHGVPVHRYWWTPGSALSAALITAALVLVRSALDLVSTRSVVAYVEDLCLVFLLRLTQGYNELQWVHHVQRNRSEMLKHATSTVREASNFYHLAIEIIASSIVLALIAIVLIHESLIAVCGIASATAGFYGVHRILINGRLRRASSNREESTRVLQQTLADTFSSAREIRSYGTQAFVQDRVRRQAQSVSSSYRQVVFLPQFARILADQGVMMAFLVVVIAIQLGQGDSRQALSLLMFYFVLCRRLLPLIGQLAFLSGQMETAYKSVQILSQELEACAANREVGAIALPPKGDVVLELEQVTFTFNRDVRVLSDVSFQMRRGELVFVCGVSGSGKSSLLNVIAGLLPPTCGSVWVDRDHIAYVGQDVVLLDESIRVNLLFGLPGAADGVLIKALAVANLADFVKAQPLGLETRVGDNGILLSGGQRQRIGLARAILRRPNLILLDEATSALDEANEAQVIENLRQIGLAVLFVTHRLKHQWQGHRVIRIESGYVMEEVHADPKSTNNTMRAAV